MKLGIIACAIALCTGCMHAAVLPQVEAGGGPPFAMEAQRYPQLPALPIADKAPPMVEVQPPAATHIPQEVECGHSLTVKVGKLEVNMPQGGSLEIAGVKTATKQYHVVLEGVEFTNTEHCLQ